MSVSSQQFLSFQNQFRSNRSSPGKPQYIKTLQRDSPPSPPTLNSSAMDDEQNKKLNDSMGSVPSEDANVEIESYLPIVAIEENSQEYSYSAQNSPQTYQKDQSSLQNSNLYGARRGPRGSQQAHVGGWGGGPDHTKTVRASLPQLFGGSYENDRNISGRVQQIDDNAMRRSRFLEARADMVKENRISISVDRKSQHDRSFQDMNFLKLGTEQSSRRNSLNPSLKDSPTHSHRESNFNLSVIRNSALGPPIKLKRQPTDNFSRVFFKAGIDPHLLQQRLLNANKVDDGDDDHPQLATVKESQNRVCLTAQSAVLQDQKKKVEKMTSVEFMEWVLTSEQIETLRSIFLKHSTVSDTRGESVMKLWQFRKFCSDFGLAHGMKSLAQMEVLYNASVRGKNGHTQQMNLAKFLMVLLQIAKKNYTWLPKEKAFKNLVERYLMKNFIDLESKKCLEFDVALREYFRAFKHDKLEPPIPDKVLKHIYEMFCAKNLSGINVTGFQKLTRHLRINPVFCSDLQAIKVYKYLQQMKIEAGPVLKIETLQIAMYLLFLPAVESDAPFSKRWKFMVKWIISAHQKLEKPIK